MSSYEYNQLLKFLYFEGYADSYEEAENLLEEMSDEEFEELYERKRAHSFPLKPSERRSVENIRRMLGGDYSVSPGSGVSTPTRSERKPDSTSTQNPKRKVRKLEFEVRENFESIVEYLFVEGYADTIENAELMAENISEEWVNEILEGYVELNRKRQNRMTDQVLRHMKNPNSDWEKIYKIENERDTQTPEVSKAKAEANRRRGEEKRKNQK